MLSLYCTSVVGRLSIGHVVEFVVLQQIPLVFHDEIGRVKQRHGYHVEVVHVAPHTTNGKLFGN